MSIAEAARILTLSRAQVEQIEGGGSAAFYSPRHKLLAVRKYAATFGPQPAAVTAAPAGPVSAVAIAGAAAHDKSSSIPAVASQADASGFTAGEEARAYSIRSGAGKPAPSRVRVALGWMLFGLLLIIASGIVFSTARGWVDNMVKQGRM